VVVVVAVVLLCAVTHMEHMYQPSRTLAQPVW
jgi:hypothetical protein